MAPVNRKHKEKMTERAEKRDKKAASAPKREEDDADEDEDDADDVDDEYEEATSSKRRVQKPKGYFANIKWKHVALLVMMTGTAVLPAVLWVVDKTSTLLNQNDAFKSMGIKLGMTPTPKERLEKFYKKHDEPEKLQEVDHLLTKYAGSYDKMIKVLESKYNDYGYFIGWEMDSDWRVLMGKEMKKTYQKARKIYQKKVPWGVQRTFYNIYYNAKKVYYKIYNVFVPPETKPKRRSSSSSSSSSRKRKASS